MLGDDVLNEHVAAGSGHGGHIGAGLDLVEMCIRDRGEAPQVAGNGALKRKEGVYNFLLLGSDKGGGNADTIIVASYDTKSQKVGVLSVPRDTMVDRDWSRNGKINAALGLSLIHI